MDTEWAGGRGHNQMGGIALIVAGVCQNLNIVRFKGFYFNVLYELKPAFPLIVGKRGRLTALMLITVIRKLKKSLHFLVPHFSYVCM